MIGFYQQGGPAQSAEQQIVALVLAAMQGDQKATLQIQQIELAARQGNQQAMLMMLMIQLVAQSMKGGVKRRLGGPLNYLRYLKAGGLSPRMKKTLESTPKYESNFDKKRKEDAKLDKLIGNGKVPHTTARDYSNRQVRWSIENEDKLDAGAGAPKKQKKACKGTKLKKKAGAGCRFSKKFGI